MLHIISEGHWLSPSSYLLKNRCLWHFPMLCHHCWKCKWILCCECVWHSWGLLRVMMLMWECWLHHQELSVVWLLSWICQFTARQCHHETIWVQKFFSFYSKWLPPEVSHPCGWMILTNLHTMCTSIWGWAAVGGRVCGWIDVVFLQVRCLILFLGKCFVPLLHHCKRGHLSHCQCFSNLRLRETASIHCLA